MKERKIMEKKEGRKEIIFIIFMQSFGLADLRSRGPSISRTFDLADLRSPGPSLIFGFADLRSPGPSVNWVDPFISTISALRNHVNPDMIMREK